MKEGRYERKIHYPFPDGRNLEAIIKTHPYGFREVYYQRQVNSIYYDTPSLTSLFENIHDSQDKAKVRLRWYGETSEPNNDAILEIKIKTGVMGYKIKSLSGKIEDELLTHKLSDYYPIVKVTYLRKYFQSYDKKFRLTMDTNIKYRGVGNTGVGNSPYNERGIVLELKYETAYNQLAGNILARFPSTISKFSKYARAVTMVCANHEDFLHAGSDRYLNKDRYK